jgi:periplasmic glucans biosynthesis protein
VPRASPRARVNARVWAKMSGVDSAWIVPSRMRGVLAAGLLVICLGIAEGAGAFGLEDVAARAQALAGRAYEPPTPIPRFMREIDYDAYQDIRFDEQRSLWRESNSRFQVMLFSPGLFYTHPVVIHVIDAEGVQRLPYRKGWFTFTDPEMERRVPADLGYAGFKLTYPLSGRGEQNQFLVFAGASYFRGVGRDNTWGLSGRGIAVNTGLPGGEEFPSFTEFWLVRPSPQANTMRIYALLDGKSLTGAYQFDVHPGEATSLKVQAVLYPREAIRLPGIAPLTSMFFYGENTTRPSGEWRGEVHDSDGLLIHDGASGEWLWRPLINPRRLEMDYLHTERLSGFGLLQRDTRFDSYQDLGARYDQRPSAWVTARGDWGPGRVVLVQLPTPSETNDNIVAFWTPVEPLPPGEPYRMSYQVDFGPPGAERAPLGQTAHTFVGDGSIVGGGHVEGAYRVIVDFRGGPLDRLRPSAPVTGRVTALEDGEVLEHFVEYNAPARAWRLSILAKPAADRPLALRAYLNEGERTLTETWTYRLPPDNDILSEGRRQ